MRIAVEFLPLAVDRPSAVIILEKEADQPVGKIGRHFPEARLVPRSGRAFDLEFVAEKIMMLLPRLDQQEIEWEPHRTAPVRVAAEERGRGFRRFVVEDEPLAVEIEDKGICGVTLRHGTHAVPAQHPGLVQKVHENAAEPMRIDDGEPDSLLNAAVHDVGDAAKQLRPILVEPTDTLREITIHLQTVTVARGDRENRNGTSDRVRLDREAAAIGKLEGVKIVAFVLVPEAALAASHSIDGRADVDEMLEELRRDVLVDDIALRELQRDGLHVEAIHRHPARAVGLVQLPARGQTGSTVEGADVVEPE